MNKKEWFIKKYYEITNNFFPDKSNSIKVINKNNRLKIIILGYLIILFSVILLFLPIKSSFYSAIVIISIIIFICGSFMLYLSSFGVFKILYYYYLYKFKDKSLYTKICYSFKTKDRSVNIFQYFTWKAKGRLEDLDLCTHYEMNYNGKIISLLFYPNKIIIKLNSKKIIIKDQYEDLKLLAEEVMIKVDEIIL